MIDNVEQVKELLFSKYGKDIKTIQVLSYEEQPAFVFIIQLKKRCIFKHWLFGSAKVLHNEINNTLLSILLENGMYGSIHLKAVLVNYEAGN